MKIKLFGGDAGGGKAVGGDGSGGGRAMSGEGSGGKYQEKPL